MRTRKEKKTPAGANTTYTCAIVFSSVVVEPGGSAPHTPDYPRTRSEPSRFIKKRRTQKDEKASAHH